MAITSKSNTYTIDRYSGTWFSTESLVTVDLTDDEVWSLDDMSDSQRVAFFLFKKAEMESK